MTFIWVCSLFAIGKSNSLTPDRPNMASRSILTMTIVVNSFKMTNIFAKDFTFTLTSLAFLLWMDAAFCSEDGYTTDFEWV
jgi:hypothetical protein